MERDTGGYSSSQEVRAIYKRLQGVKDVTEGNKGFQGVKGRVKRLQEVRKSDVGFQGVTTS